MGFYTFDLISAFVMKLQTHNLDRTLVFYVALVYFMSYKLILFRVDLLYFRIFTRLYSELFTEFQRYHTKEAEVINMTIILPVYIKDHSPPPKIEHLLTVIDNFKSIKQYNTGL